MSTFRTSDMYLAAYLHASEIELSDVESEHKKMYFVFQYDDEEDFRQVRRGWMTGGMIVASAYAQSVKHLKYLVHHPEEC